jgi:hypothetical protein
MQECKSVGASAQLTSIELVSTAQLTQGIARLGWLETVGYRLRIGGPNASTRLASHAQPSEETMVCRVRAVLLVLASISFCLACTTTGANTFRDPSLASTKLRSVAILPLQTTHLGPGISLDVNRGVVQGFVARNPGLRILSPSESQEKLGAAGLIEAYSQYLRDYATSGMTNKATLAKIGTALEVDAILQGEIAQLQQQNGYPYHPAFTQLSLRYSLVSCQSGVLLWESSARARRELTALDSAPDVYEVIPVAQQTLVAQFPVLAAQP